MQHTMASGADRSAHTVVSDLRETLDGDVITPAHTGYEQARTLFYGGFDHRPAAVVRPTGAGDVARVVRLASEAGLELAVRGGGHSSVGHSTSDGGVVVDLAAMKALTIDPVGRTAWAEAGVRAGEYTSAVGAHGLATGFGDTASVGVGGITLGGGVGFLVRRHGLTIDSLLAAEVVTADGEIRHADPETHPDLFWAIRGGGGNFGIATRLRFRLHAVDTIVGGTLVLPATPEVIAGFVAEADAAPDDLSTIANIMPAPPLPFVPDEQHGQLVVMAQLAYAGHAAEGQTVIDRFRALAAPLADGVRAMPYPQMFRPEGGGFHPTVVTQTMFVDRVDLETAERMLARLEASDAPMRVVQVRVLGGAVARVPADATAYAHRARRIMLNIAVFYDVAEQRRARQAWVDDVVAALDQGVPGAYVNFLGDDRLEQVRRAYPDETRRRLVAVKRRYDPTNLFRRNHNILPADT